MESAAARLRSEIRRRAKHYAEEPLAFAALRAKAIEPYRRRRFQAFGHGSVIHKPDWLYGTHRIAVGDYVTILNGAWLAAERPAWGRPGPAIEIGAGTVIRAHCVLSAAESIVIESNVLLAGSVGLFDSDHTITREDRNPVNNPMKTSPIRVGQGSWLGERVTVLRGATIGKHCIIAAGSVVRGDIPDNSIAAGMPARVIGSTLDEGEL